MEQSLDDGIELLQNSLGDRDYDNSATCFDQIDSNVNPLDYGRRLSIQEQPGSVPAASIHALQTAFNTLNRKHNEEVRKNSELTQRNRSMQRALMDLQSQRVHSHSMDEIHTQDPSSVHAAGGTSEGETALAEQHAQQGYVQYMQRELLKANTANKHFAEENQMLQIKVQELEHGLSVHVRERERLQNELESYKHSLDKIREECTRKDNDIDNLNENLHTNQITIRHLQEVLDDKEKHGSSKVTEIQELKSRIQMIENERMRLSRQVNDLEIRLQTKEKERSLLEVQVKQLQIETEIGRNQKQKLDSQNAQRLDESTEADEAEVKLLNEALTILAGQRTEISDLKHKITEQQELINQIQSIGKKQIITDMSLRTPAQGSSYTPSYHEHRVGDHLPGAGLLQPGTVPATQQHALLGRTHSDLGSYVNTDRMPPVSSQHRASTGNQLGMDRLRIASPRINENILPTGVQNVARMVAMESNQTQKRKEQAAIIESNAGRTRESTSESRFTIPAMSTSYGSTSPRQSASISQSPYASPKTVVSPRPGGYVNTVEYANVDYSRTKDATGGYSRSENQAFFPDNIQAEYHGARPRVPGNITNVFESKTQLHQQNIANRMTQSEIVVREHSAQTSPMARSVLEPLQPLNIPLSSSSGLGGYAHGEMDRNIPQKLSQTNHQNLYDREVSDREQYTEPDYENIYNANTQTDIKRPIEEHEDDEVFATADQRQVNRATHPVQEEIGENVAAVKICPMCNQEFSRLTLDQFQMHVFECFDNSDESPATLQASAGTPGNDEDRTCPMCSETFPLTIPQETYEQHVLSHFGDDPMMERYEMLQP